MVSETKAKIDNLIDWYYSELTRITVNATKHVPATLIVNWARNTMVKVD